jgi:hypothetical protein
VTIKRLLVDLFVETHARAPKQIILDLDGTDDPLHGQQEGRFFHGYYGCYCHLPLYVFCWSPSCGPPTSMVRPDRWRRWRALLRRSAQMAARAHFGTRRLRLRARGTDGLVRGRRGGFLFGLAQTDRLIGVSLSGSPRLGPSGLPPYRCGTPAAA